LAFSLILSTVRANSSRLNFATISKPPCNDIGLTGHPNTSPQGEKVKEKAGKASALEKAPLVTQRYTNELYPIITYNFLQ
jgi:hypothetical protein